MKVKELIDLLSRENPDDEVIMSSDGEGNSYNYFRMIESHMSFNEKNGEVGLRSLTKELQKIGYSNEDVIAGVPCLILYPH